MKVRWDPEQYRRFASHRLRPALDLAARLEALDPRTIYDLGCGTGEITRMLAARWPAARVRGIDSSREMLEKARQQAKPGRAEAPAAGAAGAGAAAGAAEFERGDLAFLVAGRPRRPALLQRGLPLDS